MISFPTLERPTRAVRNRRNVGHMNGMSDTRTESITGTHPPARSGAEQTECRTHEQNIGETEIFPSFLSIIFKFSRGAPFSISNIDIMQNAFQPQIILLREGTDTSQGKAQIISNINACQAVAETLRFEYV